MIFTIIFSLITVTSFAKDVPERSIASVRETIRVDHARELMGKYYQKSIISKQENKLDLKVTINKIVSKKLPKKYKHSLNKVVTETILKESLKHSLDPFFVMAVIEGESSFNPQARGPVGEIGLMQLRLSTGEWLAKKLKMPWNGNKTLEDPIQNVQLGTAYLAYLRSKFNGHGQLYVAAYNMGATNVRRALAKQIRPKDYPRHVMKRYLAYYKSSSEL
jgi:soluble lytic murein transglycosylase